ncbi:MAG: SURF1 family protein [Rickettsiaceae bacterium]
MINSARMQKKYTGIILNILAVIFLIGLGLWQVSRYYQKLDARAAVKNSINLHTNLIKDRDDFLKMKYSKVKIGGKFIPHKSIYLYSSKLSNKKFQYHLLSPFQMKDGNVIIVLRGSFNLRNKANIDKFYNHNVDNKYVELTGVLLPTETYNFLTPGNDVNNNLWFFIDLPKMSQYLGIDLVGTYLMELDDNNILKNNDLLQETSLDSLCCITNNHFIYACIWFSLALILIVMFFINYFTKNN